MVAMMLVANRSGALHSMPNVFRCQKLRIRKTLFDCIIASGSPPLLCQCLGGAITQQVSDAITQCALARLGSTAMPFDTDWAGFGSVKGFDPDTFVCGSSDMAGTFLHSC
jgi:hypothetical protein